MITAKQVAFRTFYPALFSAKRHFEEAARFASAMGPERLISISEGRGSTTVWYWQGAPPQADRAWP
jgi:hypothetical protein